VRRDKETAVEMDTNTARQMMLVARDHEELVGALLESEEDGTLRKLLEVKHLNIRYVRKQIDDILCALIVKTGEMEKGAAALSERLGVTASIEWYDTDDEGVDEWSAPVIAHAQFDGESHTRFAIADAGAPFWVSWLADSLKQEW
jgi:hypothetical protein